MKTLCAGVDAAAGPRVELWPAVAAGGALLLPKVLGGVVAPLPLMPFRRILGTGLSPTRALKRWFIFVKYCLCGAMQVSKAMAPQRVRTREDTVMTICTTRGPDQLFLLCVILI